MPTARSRIWSLTCFGLRSTFHSPCVAPAQRGEGDSAQVGVVPGAAEARSTLGSGDGKSAAAWPGMARGRIGPRDLKAARLSIVRVANLACSLVKNIDYARGHAWGLSQAVESKPAYPLPLSLTSIHSRPGSSGSQPFITTVPASSSRLGCRKAPWDMLQTEFARA